MLFSTTVNALAWFVWKKWGKTGSQKIVDLGQFPSLLFKVTDIQLDDDIQSKKCPEKDWNWNWFFFEKNCGTFVTWFSPPRKTRWKFSDKSTAEIRTKLSTYFSVLSKIKSPCSVVTLFKIYLKSLIFHQHTPIPHCHKSLKKLVSQTVSSWDYFGIDMKISRQTIMTGKDCKIPSNGQ